MIEESLFLVIFCFLFGLCIGSFLNAVIFRLPRKISLSASRSHCPRCNKLINWYENIPVISYLFLRGKCSNCKSSISIEYPIVEIVVGLFALSIAPREISADSLWKFFFFLSVFSSFLAIVIIDLRFHIIPNVINIYLGVLFLCAVVFKTSAVHWLGGMAIGSLFPASVAAMFYYLKGVEGLGGGDIKLWGVLGIYLGPSEIMYNISFSCFLGALVGGILILTKVIDKRTRIPFGPFIVLVAFAQVFLPSYFNSFTRALFTL